MSDEKPQEAELNPVDEIRALRLHLADAIERMQDLQYLLHALVAYVEEQPQFSRRRLRQLYERERTRFVSDPARPLADRARESALRDWLEDQQDGDPH